MLDGLVRAADMENVTFIRNDRTGYTNFTMRGHKGHLRQVRTPESISEPQPRSVIGVVGSYSTDSTLPISVTITSKGRTE
jgi:hypothetical protein